MLGLPSKTPESAPPYEALDAIEAQPREPNNPNGYSTISSTDPDPVRADEQHPLQHGYLHSHPRSPGPPGRAGCRIDTLPPPSTFQPHTHCEVCDGFLTRQQRMRNERFICAMVTLGIISAILCGMGLGIVIARSRRRY
ncbi:uncharacterized protein DSM5745_09305 [Aspergillus mulundensis]|uniref:LITAF domain-containing protein n=1 Tax=Aspergillus mulundensis TaxID=1810919 RepID=A0A3D8R064_9EURO|nr:hypothetical protein DSM5745_09305 [Aspergillus mulundensis]RDW67439.1 hypothetical protein DSM5745_09305 [Aspergillus mulundensis]